MDNLTVFGTDYTGVTGIKAKGTGNGTLTYIRPSGTKSIGANGTGIDVTQYASVDVAVPDSTFVVTVSYNSTTEMWEPDCTWAQASAAYSAGKTFAINAAYTSGFVTADGNWDANDSALIYFVHLSTTISGTDTIHERFYSLGQSELTEFDALDYIIPYGTTSITTNGTHDVADYALADVNVSGGGSTRELIVPQQTVTPNSSRQAVMTGVTAMLVEGESYLVTLDGTEYIETCGVLWSTDYVIGDQAVIFGTTDVQLPFAIDMVSAAENIIVMLDTSQHTVKVEHIELGSGATVLTTKTITANGTYNASSDSADGYSSVTVNVSGGGGTPRTSADLTVSGATVTAPAGVYASDASKSVASMTLPTAASATSSGTSKATITPGSSAQYINIPTGYNGTASYYTISATSGSSKNVQVAQSTSRATSSTYTSVCSLTCSTAGTYDVYWDCFRSSTGGTNGSQLYVGGSAYGSANTAFTNHIQTNHLTGVSLTKNQTVAVYARSRGSNYYAYCGQLTIVQTA